MGGVSVCVLVSMTCDSIFTIVLYSNGHDHMRTAEIFPLVLNHIL